MIELKIPKNDKTIGWIVHLKDGDQTKFVGFTPFAWTWRYLTIHSKDEIYHFMIRDVVRLERIQFLDIESKEHTVLETFCFV